MEPLKEAQETQRQDHPDGHKLITVTINQRPVVFEVHKATGAEIKDAAIAQGISIQRDFVLFEMKGVGQLKAVGDADLVNLHEGQAFRAVAPDDNS